MKREVATKESVFPWSMSDFKPGELKMKTMSRTMSMGLLCHSYAQKLSDVPG